MIEPGGLIPREDLPGGLCGPDAVEGGAHSQDGPVELAETVVVHHARVRHLGQQLERHLELLSRREAADAAVSAAAPLRSVAAFGAEREDQRTALDAAAALAPTLVG